jgi:serine phosphatase RsbU (regulator of sigma subunit)
MFKSHLKKTIRKAQAGIAFIIFAAILSQVLNITQFIYTRKRIRQQSIERTYHYMERTQRVAKLETSVESAVQATIGEVQVHLDNPDMFYGITSRLVSNNDYIVGSAVAMRPGYYPQKDRLFAPFAYPENIDKQGQPRTKLLPYDYTKQDWFAIPFENDSAIWTEPYFDKGGSDLLIRTYSLPIHGQNNEVIGILTADVFFKDLASDNETTSQELDRVNIVGFFFQFLGLLLIFYIVWKYTTKFKQVNNLIVEQELLSKELQIASDIQSAMLPNISEIENARHHLDVQKVLASAPDVSADFYDYFYVGTKVVFCIGDVPGSNVKAALMMSVIRSIFRTSATLNCQNEQTPSPATIVSSMNNSLCTINYNEMFSTLFVGVLDLNTAQLTYCNAGNPAPVVVSPSLGAKLLEVESNVPVGLVENFNYIEQRITLIEDFTLFLYNDGLFETANTNYEPYGQKRMLTRLNACARNNVDPKKMLSIMQEAVESHRGSAPQTDDLLMLTMKIV